MLEVACGGGEESCGVEGEGSLVGPCDPPDCPVLVDPFTVPWDADELTLSKGNRVRVMADGAHVMTPLNVDLTPGIATDWQNVRLDAHFTDLWTDTARRINVGIGASSRGFPVSTKFAVEPVIRPLRARGHDAEGHRHPPRLADLPDGGADGADRPDEPRPGRGRRPDLPHV